MVLPFSAKRIIKQSETENLRKRRENVTHERDLGVIISHEEPQSVFPANHFAKDKSSWNNR